MTLRDQILARIDETPHRAPTFFELMRCTNSAYRNVEDSLKLLLADRVIDTEQGDCGLTYKRAKACASPSPYAPAPMPQTERSGLAFFPSKSANAQPVWHGYNTPSEKQTIRACTVPKAPCKRELAAHARDYKAVKVRAVACAAPKPVNVKELVLRAKASEKQVVERKKAEKANRAPPDRTSYENRALVSRHLTYPMSAAQFAEIAGLKELSARSMLFNMGQRGFLKKDVQRQPKLYFFERPANDKVAEFRELAKQFKARRDLDPAAIVADYAAGAKMKELAKKWKTSEAKIGEILDEQGVKRRPRGQLIKGKPRSESTALKAENEALKARIKQLEAAK